MSTYTFGKCIYCGKEGALKDGKCVKCGAILPNSDIDAFTNLFGKDNPFAKDLKNNPLFGGKNE